jgi:hypothetical protein
MIFQGVLAKMGILMIIIKMLIVFNVFRNVKSVVISRIVLSVKD